MKELGSRILKNITEGETEMSHFDDFSMELVSALKGIFSHQGTCRSQTVKREKSGSAFHQLRVVHLPSIWNKFLSFIIIDSYDPLLEQPVNQKLFEMILGVEFSSVGPPVATTKESSMGKDELNALRYAGGFVPHSLLKRYEKKSGKKFEEYVECLGSMAVESDFGDFLDYTKDWIDRVNRGGLFPLNDITFEFFVAVERRVKGILPDYVTGISKSKEDFQVQVLDTIVADDNIKWHWTLLSQCIDSEDHAIELLREIVKL